MAVSDADDGARSPSVRLADVESDLGERRPLLGPDDPQVSALNVPFVRLMRQLTVGAAVFDGVLLLLLVLSDFIAIPGFHTFGRAYFEVTFVAMALANNLVALYNFQIPSKTERVLGYVSGGWLVLDLLVVVVVGRIRAQFGLFGVVVLAVSALQLAAVAVFDHYVEVYKRRQEIRLTGREETRMLFAEIWVVASRISARGVMLLWVALVLLTIWLHAFDALRVDPWGNMVPVEDGQLRIHLACYGNVTSPLDSSSTPIPIIEGGELTLLELFALWVRELHHLNQLDRYCVWDRPGYGFSDSSPSPVLVSIVAEYLAAALEQQGVQGPFTLVAHDIGGLYARVFALRFPAAVHLMLLVDAWHEDLLLHWPFFPRSFELEPMPLVGKIHAMSAWNGFKLWVRGLLLPLGLEVHRGWLLHRHGSVDRLYGRDMQYQGKVLRYRLQEQITALVLLYPDVKRSSLKDVLLSVVLSGHMIENLIAWGEWQRTLTKLGAGAKEWVIADKAPHEVWHEPKSRKELQAVLLRLMGLSKQDTSLVLEM